MSYVEIVDICNSYVEDKNVSYLAKEGLIVSYYSITGRQSDFMWHKMTVIEVLRIIKATRMTYEQSRELTEAHLITAFQELERVYEFGVKTRHSVVEGVFNYSQHADTDVGDDIMARIAEMLLIEGKTAVLVVSIMELFDKIQSRVKTDIGMRAGRELLYKYFETGGYIIRSGAYRPLVEGKKQVAAMMPGTKPASVVRLTQEELTRLASLIGEELK